MRRDTRKSSRSFQGNQVRGLPIRVTSTDRDEATGGVAGPHRSQPFVSANSSISSHTYLTAFSSRRAETNNAHLLNTSSEGAGERGVPPGTPRTRCQAHLQQWFHTQAKYLALRSLHRQKPILSRFTPPIASAGPPIQGIVRPA